MKKWFPSFGLLAYLAGVVAGNEVLLTQDDANRQRCAGMYSRKDWGGPVDPFMQAKVLPTDVTADQDPILSLIIFEWQDEHLIGRYPPGVESGNKDTICSPDQVSAQLCKEEDIGTFILAPNATELAKNPLITQAIHLNTPNTSAIDYPIRRTGYYCISTFAYSGHDYKAAVVFRNAYGELPAAQIAKLPFYGGLTITYAVMGIFWAFLYVQHRSDILAVQNYITATIIFLIAEQLMTWGFYDYQNRHGNNALNKFFLVVVSILNAARNSLSFFLLLIVCMGYGVVKHSLGKTMIYVRFLALAHFVFGMIYAIASLSVTPESAGLLVLLVILPLAATLTAFYVWTLSSLNLTLKDLVDRKQKTKAKMYKKLWWCILGSIIVIFVFFFANSFAFASRNEDDFVPDHWRSRWFVLDGWLNIVYLFDIAFIAFLWRPTANNRRFAMSDELAQDDDGNFEIRSIAGLSDEDDDAKEEDEEAQRYARLEENAVQPSGGAATSISATLPEPNHRNDVQPKNPPRPRESLDGEILFAVGGEDGDEWSEGEEEGDERRKLTTKI